MKLYSPIKNRIVTSPYGGERTHNGTDYRAAIGTKIYCPQDGIVKAVYNTTAGGKQIIIDHAGGFRTGYAHLSEALVKDGDTVKSNQIIGKTGNTGVGTGPHLHFTVKKYGKRIDPETVIIERSFEQQIKEKTENKGLVFFSILALIIISILIYRNYVHR